MVSSTLTDALTRPHAVLESLYEEFKSSQDGLQEGFPSLVAKHFQSVFDDNDKLSQINHLTHSNLNTYSRSPTLVHFRGMVQDTSPSPEVYLVSHNGRACGWGLDDLQGTEDDERNQAGGSTFSELVGQNLSERSVVWAISIPGESEWSQKRARNSRGGAVNGLNGHMNGLSLQDPDTPSSSHKFPLPEQKHVALRVKVYESSEESLKPTSLASFVGILTREETQIDDFSLLSTELRTTSAPVLHVLFHRPITDGINQMPYPHGLYSDSLRSELIEWIANEGLGGDLEAAEWVLFACISNIQSRNPPLLPLSLALTSTPKPSDAAPATPTLAHILALLLPLNAYLPLSLDYLNRHSFEPESKDEDLHAGTLQLPPRTVVLVSDHGMEEGRLDQKGLQNVQALQDVISRQTLRYNFPFSGFTLPTELNFIVMTEGSKCAFCETTVSIPLRPRTSSPNYLYKARGVINLPPSERLDAFRDYIISARSGKATVDEGIARVVQDSFVQERQESGSNIGPNDLIRRMAVAKLLALSRHHEKLSKEVWEEAVRFDNARIGRSS